MEKALQDYASDAFRFLDQVLQERHHLFNGQSKFLPLMASSHLSAAIKYSDLANHEGAPSVALGLIRHAVESMSIVELQLMDPADSASILDSWVAGRARLGEVRKFLEGSLWRTLPDTPWGVSWVEHEGSLAKAVQDYSHASPSLMQWTLRFQQRAPGSGGTWIGAIGRNDGIVDLNKGERIQLVIGILYWTLTHHIQRFPGFPISLQQRHLAITTEIADSKWLDRGQPWAEQLIPHVWIDQGTQP